MLRILDTPVLELLIAQLRQHGVTQIMIKQAHHAEVIEQHFGDGRRFGVEIAYSFEGHTEDGQLVGEPIRLGRLRCAASTPTVASLTTPSWWCVAMPSLTWTSLHWLPPTTNRARWPPWPCKPCRLTWSATTAWSFSMTKAV